MLIELGIKDFAIIESLTLTLGPGLNIFTGETGAGKSIIMDAISLILGDRATNEIIRGGSEEAQVEAMFDVAGHAAIEGVLGEAGIPHSESLVIKRVIQRAGRNKIYINGSLATLVTLTEIGRRLIDIYGQSEHQSLTRPEEHIESLDSYGGFTDLRAAMADSFRKYIALKKELDMLQQDSRTSGEKRDLLAFQLKEITDASLSPGEEDSLKKDKERLQNAEKIRNAVVAAEAAIYSEGSSIVERLGTLVKALKEAALFDERLAKTVESIEGSLFQLEDAASFLRGYSETIESDPEKLDVIGARLDLINRLKKKYGSSVEEIIEKGAAVEKELSAISGFEERVKELDARVSAAREAGRLAANKLTEARTKAARVLKGKIEAELNDLGMKGSVFDCMIDTEKGEGGAPRLGEKGSDRVTFYISTNPGEEVKPLARIASGGELSRIMLAMKRVAAAGRVPTLVFDEIDTGVGGAMAQVVGLKLKEVSRAHQVLCITHLPQIAAFADRHYSVTKEKAKDGRTVTAVRVLQGDGRLEELSVMLGGLKVTDTTRKHAGELLDSARDMAGKKASTGKSKR